jgi:hypothetical protein
MDPNVELSRRERQIMNVVYGQGQATAIDVHSELPDAPSPTAVRTTLGILVRKGWPREVGQPRSSEGISIAVEHVLQRLHRSSRGHAFSESSNQCE